MRSILLTAAAGVKKRLLLSPRFTALANEIMPTKKKATSKRELVCHAR
jgi:hypothetical protein